jgi:hypothetical protein
MFTGGRVDEGPAVHRSQSGTVFASLKIPNTSLPAPCGKGILANLFWRKNFVKRKN